MKTYLMNQNGGTIMKQHKSKKIVQKSTLDDKLTQRKMALLAKKQKSIQEKIVQVPVVSFVPTQKPSPQKINKINLLEEIKKTQEKILNGGKQSSKNQNELQRKLFLKICRIVNVQGEPHGKTIPFDTLNDPFVIKDLYNVQENLREAFPSSKLTALHSNAIKKQSFPGVNIVRQIFKEMGYKLQPVNISEGYLGSKKLLRRYYKIKKT